MAQLLPGQRANELSKYQLESYTYPDDLFTPNYGGNYVVFFINVAEDGQLVKSGEATVADEPNRLRGQTIGANISKTAATIGAGIAGAAGGGILGSIFGGGNAVGGGILGGAVSALGTAALPTPKGGQLTRPQKRLQTAIALYMPNQLNIRYGVQYEEESMLGLNIVGQGEEVLSALAEGKTEGAGSAVRNIAANVALTVGTPLANQVAFGAGVAANPKKEQVFKGIDFRSFQFNYQFYPRDADEARNVLEIIRLFKLHMHPELKDGDGFLYIYPSEFDIVYYNGTSTNDAIHKHTSCVLKDLNINYAPQGQFNTFGDGMPTQINIDMTFLELGLLTKTEIQQGL